MNVFDHDSYKKFVLAYVTSMENHGWGEWARIAKKLNISSTLISQIFRGSKELTPDQAFELTEYWGLSDLESDYFILLVQIERAGTQKYRLLLQKKLDLLKEKAQNLKDRLPQDSVLTEETKTFFYSSWLYSALWVLSSIPKYQSIDAMAQVTGYPRHQIRKALDFLITHGLCYESASKITIGPQQIHLESSSPLIGRHHSNWRQKAIEKSDKITSSELMFTAPLSISKEDFMKLRNKIVTFIAEIGVLVKKSPAEITACLNIDFFEF